MLGDRFWSKVAKAGELECWHWQASTSPRGYGQYFHNGRHSPAHRVSYEDAHGAIPDGMVIDHLCRTRSCVNPSHLEPVTNAENIRRGIAGLLNTQKGQAITHCRFGHEYTPENTRHNPRGSRCCRTCGRINSSKHTARRVAAKQRARAHSTKENTHVR